MKRSLYVVNVFNLKTSNYVCFTDFYISDERADLKDQFTQKWIFSRYLLTHSADGKSGEVHKFWSFTAKQCFS